MPPRRIKVRLPRVTRNFLRTKAGRWTKFLVLQLHRYMNDEQLSLSKMQPSHVHQFLAQLLDRPLTSPTRAVYRCQLLRYFDYLHIHGRIDFDPKRLRKNPRSAQPLPPIAERFLQTLRLTHKPSTVGGYRYSIHKLHNWLDRRGIAVSEIDRDMVTDFLQQLSHDGLQPQTRVGIIVHIRSFLRWHQEQTGLPQEPERLIRPSDLPKRPSYLPRPLPPDSDRELQRRLHESDGLYPQGLLLMRRTGLRIGELVSLDYDCLRSEPSGRRFLKVPLGKLANERLVPLDRQTVELIERMQSTGSTSRRWLLQTTRGKRTNPNRYRDALREAGEGLPTDGPLTPHRLRHSFATSLLSAGMSLVAVMQLLGHRDYRMTLRYAAITQETVTREYFKALTKIEDRYQPIGTAKLDPRKDMGPGKLLSDLARWIQKHVGHELGRKSAARALVKRVERLRADVQRQIQHDQEPHG